MSETRSTGYKNALTGKVAEITALLSGTGIAFIDGGDGNDKITDTGNGFLAAGFKAGDLLRVIGSQNNNKVVEILSVTAAEMEVASGSLTAAAAGAQVCLAAARGGSARDLFDFGVICLYSGAKPSSADDAETGTLLAVLTNNGEVFTPGVKDAAGLRFGAPEAGAIGILSGQTWKTNGCLATGTIGWGRLYANARLQGASTKAVRTDFTVGTTGADLNLSSTAATAGAPLTLSSFTITAN